MASKARDPVNDGRQQLKEKGGREEEEREREAASVTVVLNINILCLASSPDQQHSRMEHSTHLLNKIECQGPSIRAADLQGQNMDFMATKY